MNSKNKNSWADPSKYISHVYVDKSVKNLDYTKEILDRVKCQVSVIPENSEPEVDGIFPENLKQGKKNLFLTKNKGSFFKPCPGTLEYQCCDYHVLNIGMNCPIDCVYCILQAYITFPWITVYVNIDKMFNELGCVLTEKKNKFFRIGTGEFTDSLALENVTGYSAKLIEFLKDYDNVILELKTKSSAIDKLLPLDHYNKTILAWSLNSEEIVKKEEIRSAPLLERLNAAREAAERGYHLAFHFDPIIYHDNWKEGYYKTIEMLFKLVPKESIVWISLGALRYLPPLKNIGIKRFPHSRIFFQEFISGLDNKSRYFRTLREEMYSYIYSLLKSQTSPDTCLYFCMESNEIWREVMNFTPDEKGGIGTMLDKAAIKAINKI